MAKSKQFTVAVDNQPGAVAGIAKTLGNAKVNIFSLLGTAQGTAATVEVVVDDARRAKKVLDAARIAYAETPAELYDLPNKPGALARCLEKLAAKGVNLNSIRATAAKRPSWSTPWKLPHKPQPPTRRDISFFPL